MVEKAKRTCFGRKTEQKKREREREREKERGSAVVESANNPGKFSTETLPQLKKGIATVESGVSSSTERSYVRQVTVAVTTAMTIIVVVTTTITAFVRSVAQVVAGVSLQAIVASGRHIVFVVDQAIHYF